MSAATYSKKYTVSDTEEIYSKIGFGKYQYQLLFIVGGGMACDTIEISLLAFVQSCVVAEWGISTVFESILTSAVLLGQLLGMFFIGPLADRHGRRPVMLFGWLMTIVFGFLSCFSPDIWVLILTRLLVGVGIGASLAISFDLFTESLPGGYRTQLVLLSIFSVIGELFVAGMAWGTLSTLGWRYLTFFAALPTLIVTVFGYYLLKESPRWLISVGQVSKAERILISIAKKNGLHDFENSIDFSGYRNSSHTASPHRSKSHSFSSRQHSEDEEQQQRQQQSPQSVRRHNTEEAELLDLDIFANWDDDPSTEKSYLDGFCNRVTIAEDIETLFTDSLAGTTTVVWMMWFMQSFAFYSVSLLLVFNFENSTDGTCSFYYAPLFMTYTLEFAGIFSGYFLNCFSAIGRVGSQTLLYSLSMVFLILFISLRVTDDEVAYQIMIMCAKITVCGAVPITWLHTAELYPTKVRGTGHSMASVYGKLGGVMAIFWIDYFTIEHYVAGVTICVIAMFSTAVLPLFLMETKSTTLNDDESAVEAVTNNAHTKSYALFTRNVNTLIDFIFCSLSTAEILTSGTQDERESLLSNASTTTATASVTAEVNTTSTANAKSSHSNNNNSTKSGKDRNKTVIL